MPSFDIVSEINMHEVQNAVDQAQRELGNRWDFKNVEASFELADKQVTVGAEQEFQVEQMIDMLRMAFAKRQLDLRALKEEKESRSGKLVRRHFSLREGIDQPTAKDLVKRIKESKIKVQASIQGDKLRVTGKKRDELQETIALLRAAELDIPLQFDNFRD
ncbi:YajQ family cyclic di-GMP-binding protein [Mangrovitalea sediminis]|uniref:YajQ family cyclic di-GMP-binding protein n=1 Tax=Mangrovitalea sediminis TaxID=1982043 RepID=UPI000BE5DA92|nr:YajQ family cyclic di-GMP-binding protein [Mangrovitalea sediminis]